MNQKVLQEVENAMVDAVMDSAASLGLTPLQRAKFIVAISETLIDAITPYVQHQDAAPPAKVVRRYGATRPACQSCTCSTSGRKMLRAIPSAAWLSKANRM